MRSLYTVRKGEKTHVIKPFPAWPNLFCKRNHPVNEKEGFRKGEAGMWFSRKSDNDIHENKDHIHKIIHKIL